MRRFGWILTCMALLFASSAFASPRPSGLSSACLDGRSDNPGPPESTKFAWNLPNLISR